MPIYKKQILATNTVAHQAGNLQKVSCFFSAQNEAVKRHPMHQLPKGGTQFYVGKYISLEAKITKNKELNIGQTKGYCFESSITFLKIDIKKDRRLVHMTMFVNGLIFRI